MEWRHTRWDQAQLVYTAIAKVANTSIKSALLETFAPDVSRSNPHDAEMPYSTVRPGRVAADAPGYLHFAVVRDPFDRFVSFWADKIVGDGMNEGLRRLGFDVGMSFSDTVRRAVEIPDDETDPHIRSQAFLLADDHGRLIVDLVLRFERLSDDWDLLRAITRARSGVDLVPLRKRRVSQHEKSASYFDDELSALVRSRYDQDFELLNYDGPTVRRRRIPTDDRVEALIADLGRGTAVLDLTPATIDRIRTVHRAGGHYLSPARHNKLGQLVRFTALEQGRILPTTFDVLIVDEGASLDREPHRMVRRSFEDSGRAVLLV